MYFDKMFHESGSLKLRCPLIRGVVKARNHCIYIYMAKKMCASDFPTDSPFPRRPTQVFLLCDSKFFYWGSYRKKK